jgi:hypothetical protein
MYTKHFAGRAAVFFITGTIGACGFVNSSDYPEAAAATPAAAADGTAAAAAAAAADATSVDVNETSARGGVNSAVSKPAGTTATGGATLATPATTSAPVTSTTAGGATASASLKALPLGTLSASGPVVIDGGSGAVVTGRRISNPGGDCVVVRNGATNVRIEGNQIGPCGGDGVSIQSGSSGVVVTGNNVAGVSYVGIKTQDVSGVRAINNFIDGASTAMRAVRSSRVEFEFNGAMNIRGRYPDGQLAQLDNVTGSGSRVQCNATDLSVGGPNPETSTATAEIRTEDVINTWQSRGDASDPILIAYNRLKGGGSFTGSGIMSGDGGGSNISVVGNRIVNPWNAGIGVAGGSGIRIEGNKVFSELPALVAGEGFYIRNFGPGSCSNIVHQNNQINWPPADWSTAGWVQSFWQPAGECTNVTGTSSNNLNATALTKAIFTEPIAECRARASALGLPTNGY